MLFQIYGEGAIYQLLGWVLVFAGLVICNELARRSKFGGLLFFIIIPIAENIINVGIYEPSEKIIYSPPFYTVIFITYLGNR